MVQLNPSGTPGKSVERATAAVILAALLLCPTVSGAYTGFLTSPVGITGTGNWIVNGPTTIRWTITYDALNDWWDYAYTLSHPADDTVNFILETSQSVGNADIFDVAGDFSVYWIGTHHQHPNNTPGMPAAVYGIRFESAWGLTTNIGFRSTRAPTWGDFYSRDGYAGGQGINAAWNAGFTAADWDPASAPANNPIANHILVPSSLTQPIPEPGSLWLLGGGLLALALARRRRT